MTSQHRPSPEGKKGRTSGWRRFASGIAVGGLIVLSSLVAPMASADDGIAPKAPVVETAQVASSDALSAPSEESPNSPPTSSAEIVPEDVVDESVVPEAEPTAESESELASIQDVVPALEAAPAPAARIAAGLVLAPVNMVIPVLTDPVGLNNAYWDLTLQDTSQGVTFALVNGDLIATSPTTPAVIRFTDGTLSHNFGPPVDSGVQTPVVVVPPMGVDSVTPFTADNVDIDGVVVVMVPAPHGDDQYFLIAYDAADATGNVLYNSDLAGDSRPLPIGSTTITIPVAGALSVLFGYGADGNVYRGVFNLSDISSPPTVIPVPPTPGVTDPAGPNNATWNRPDNTDVLEWAVDGMGNLVVTIIPPNTTFPAAATSHDYGTAPDSYVPSATGVVTASVSVTASVTASVVVPPETTPPVVDTTPVVTTSATVPSSVVTTTATTPSVNVDVTESSTAAVVDSDPGNPYPTGSYNGGPGTRFPVVPVAALTLVAGIALAIALRRRETSHMH